MKIASWILGVGGLAVALATVTLMPTMFGSTSEAATLQVEVKIDSFAFAPPTITIAAGTTVRWINQDEIPHTVVSGDKSFKSKVLDTHEEFSNTFTTPGTYTYFCSIHPQMKGKIVVQ